MILLRDLIKESWIRNTYEGWLSPNGKFFGVGAVRGHERAARELIKRFYPKPKLHSDSTRYLGDLGWLRIVVINTHPTIMTADTTGDIDKFKISKKQKIFLEDWLFNDTDRIVIINGKDYSSGDITS